MEWVKSSNVITVTKSVTSVEAVITRYLLTSKSEGVTIDGEVWSDIRQYPTSEYRYVWAYDTYHYTDRTTGHTSPYILDTYQAPRFEVNFSTDSYEIHPRWSSVSYITFTITKLNGLTGNVTFRQTSSSKGIGLPIYDSSSGVYSISIENKSTTSTSFSLVVSIGNCVETFTLNGIMVDADSKYLGTVTSLPDNRECVDGDRCFYKPSSNEGSIYIYDAEEVSWKEINDSSLGLTDSEKSVIYTEAMKDIIEHIPSGSSILSEYGFFDTIISHIIKADVSFVDDMYAKNLNVENGNFKFEITSGIIKVSYNGNTVFQIDPSSGNVFFGQPNSGLNAPLSGFMYDTANQRIVSKDNKVVINENGSIYALDGSFSGTINAINGSFAGTLNGATGSFNGNFSTPSLDCRPSSGGTSYSGTLSAGNYESQFKVMESLRLSIGGMDELVSCTVSNYPDIKYVSYYVNNGFATSYIYAFYNASLQRIKNGNIYLGIAKNNLKGDISYDGLSSGGTITVSKGTGSILVFKDIGAYSSSLISGQIYKNSNNQLCIVP